MAKTKELKLSYKDIQQFYRELAKPKFTPIDNSNNRRARRLLKNITHDPSKTKKRLTRG